MEISINGKPADVVLETEKNVGDLLSGMEQWLRGSGNRLSGICIDGMETTVQRLPEVMERELAAINTLDIRISTWDELAAEALANLKGYCNLYAASSFEERQQIRRDWEESASGTFLGEEIKDIHNITRLSFAGEGITAADLGILVDERMRELADPGAEIGNIEKPVSEITVRMTDLPLDVQTGKDGRAAETIQLFSRMGEKIFRILQIQGKRGLDLNTMQIDGIPAKSFLNDFGDALKELTEACGNQDTVLIGDLAEYELAPRLNKLFIAIRDFSLQEANK